MPLYEHKGFFSEDSQALWFIEAHLCKVQKRRMHHVEKHFVFGWWFNRAWFCCIWILHGVRSWFVFVQKYTAECRRR